MTINPDLQLWGTVLLVGLHDAAKGIDPDWIGSDDFHTVCALAGVEADAVLQAYDPDRFTRWGRLAA